MTARDAAGLYREAAVTTAGPAQLVALLYDGALAAIGCARRHLDGDRPDPEAAHRELTRAQDILVELQMSLDHGAGGGISSSLDALYDFCLDRLVAANLAKDTRPLQPVTTVLLELRDAWNGAVVAATLTGEPAA